MTDLQIARWLVSVCPHCAALGELAVLMRFLLDPGFSDIADWRLRLACADMAGHVTPMLAVEALQQIVGTPPDGILLHDTLWRVAHGDAVRIREKVIGATLRAAGQSRIAQVLEAA
jgi:hypothetical protein